MNESLKLKIEAAYGIEILNFSEAPRQFVAETFFITTATRNEYFVKTINKKLFINEVIEGLPALDSLYKSGITNISCPIRTKTNNLYLLDQGTLIILFTKIDAQQSYDYNEASLGELLAQIHQATNKINTTIPVENFNFPYSNIFAEQFEGILSGELVRDVILKDLQSLLKTHEAKIRMQYKSLQEFAIKAKAKNSKFVITHGDSGGNVLVASRDKIYLIDWDNMLLAPPERDTWVLEGISNFLDGYKKVYPDYKSDYDITIYYTLKYYFSSMVHRFSEILGDKPEEYRKEQFEKFVNNLIEGWMVPYLKKADLY